MILNALMFVLGAWSVQQMAYLPSPALLTGIFLAALIMWCTLLHPRCSFQLHKVLRSSIFGLAALLFSIVWTSGFAIWRMNDELPHQWEQKTIVIVGVVASVPEVAERGVRFHFDVERIISKEALVPKHISLNQYVFFKNANNSEQETPPINQFHAGERWQLTVRLKRPHGTANPHGFDFESWALGENIRATGSIKNNAANSKLDDFVWRPSYMVEHLRERIKQRIERVLAHKPYSGVIQALVMGDDKQISADDWQVFLRTGTSHLMSISGLHITMLAGLAFGIVGFFWRRIPTL
ncbi:MAG: ComEC/Rec2 family competence protein, partial [Methylotenera sp.]|nr:ComEC/Rec2 family competence protein [Methylotenera sp.]